MKVLLLSCSTGGGHDAAAKALYEKFQEFNIECTIIDPIRLSSKGFSNKLNNIYIKIVNHRPNLFKNIYHLAERYGNLKIKSPVYAINRLFVKNLKEYIEENQFDVAVATHLFPVEILTAMKKKYPTIPFIAVATDYVSIPFWEETDPNYFVIPSKDLINDFTKKGINESKLLPFGIPVSVKFANKTSKNKARKLLNLNTKKPIVLIMSGSMGFGNIEDMIRKIQTKYQNNIHIIVICGNNNNLKLHLENLFLEKHIIIKGFVNNVDVYMDACDVILTKPGGLTSTETAVKNIPTIFTNPIPGCENYNANFFKEKGMAFVSNNQEQLIEYIDILVHNHHQIKAMLKNQSTHINKNSTTDIVKFIIDKYQI